MWLQECHAKFLPYLQNYYEKIAISSRKMHIGKNQEEFKCHPVFVDNWKESDGRNEAGKEVIKDICLGKVKMEEA